MTTTASPAPAAVAPDDPRLRPHFADEGFSFGKPRLSPEQVEQYERDGYLLYKEPVLPTDAFRGLRDRFEVLLGEHTRSGLRPEAMDTPHFADHKLFDWVFSPEILDLVEPLIGPDIALFSTHFLAKPARDGKRVPWHEDSYYWRNLIAPMHVCTVWLSIDPSIAENSCMNVIPKALHGYSDYEDLSAEEAEANVFPAEINWLKGLETHEVAGAKRGPNGLVVRAARCELRPNEASLHDARLIHGSDANRSELRRCGYTMRFIPAQAVYHQKNHKWPHQIYLARGQGHPDNDYADPTRDYPDLFQQRFGTGNSH